jgi:hypothetical protein
MSALKVLSGGTASDAKDFLANRLRRVLSEVCVLLLGIDEMGLLLYTI